MDFHESLIKLEQNVYEFEDSNENYLQLDFEIGVDIKNESPELEDLCSQDAEREHYLDAKYYETIKQELEIVEDNKQVSCSTCFKMFSDSHALYQHNLKHLQVVLPILRHLFQCDYCSCYCTTKGKLRRHIQAKHFLMMMDQRGPVSKSLQRCQICNKTYTYRHWHEHMMTVHNNEKSQCKECNKSFKCTRYLRRHLLYVHGGVRPSWRFRNVSIGKVSIGIEFRCALCPTVFSNKSAYSAHVRNCHSTDVLECTLCHSKLKSRSYLLTHIKRVHYNDGNLYRCDICSKVFRSPRYLNIHKKNSHYVRVKTMRSKRSSTSI